MHSILSRHGYEAAAVLKLQAQPRWFMHQTIRAKMRRLTWAARSALWGNARKAGTRHEWAAQHNQQDRQFMLLMIDNYD